MNLPTDPEFPARNLAGFCAALLLAAATHAAETITANAPPANPEAQGGQTLGQAAEDPTASLMSVQLADWYTARFHGLSDEDANTVVLRSAIPFKAGDLNHIFRATVPFITDSPSLDAGLSDMTLFDLIVFNQRWGRWGRRAGGVIAHRRQRTWRGAMGVRTSGRLHGENRKAPLGRIQSKSLHVRG
jgi:hypothetical protein